MTQAARSWRWLPFGEHALHPILIALLLLILVVKPLTDMALLPRHSLGIGMLLVIGVGILVLACPSSASPFCARPSPPAASPFGGWRGRWQPT